jgi:hypothetical protein
VVAVDFTASFLLKIMHNIRTLTKNLSMTGELAIFVGYYGFLAPFLKVY